MARDGSGATRTRRRRRPGAGRRLRSARLTPRGLSVVVVGVVGLIGAYSAGRSELLYLGLLALLLPGLAIAFARFRRVDIAAARGFVPPVVAVGQPTTVELTASNQSYTPTPRLAWRDYRPWAAGGNRPGSLPPLAPRRASSTSNQARMRYPLVAPRRGVFEIGPMTVVLADPFALAQGEVVVGGTDTLVVTPLIATLADNGLAILASEGSSMLVRRAIGGEDDLSTREYRTGDALRRVHWRATARHGELMVRQEEPRSHAEARIIVDTRRSGYGDAVLARGDAVESESFELAMSIASSIALHLSRVGFQAELVETASPQLAPVAPLEPFLRSLALVGLSDELGAFATGSALAAASRPDNAHGSVFAVLADADPSTVERLVAQRQSFDLAVAFVIGWSRSPQLDRLTTAGWTCVPVSLDDSVDDAWSALASIHGARHGR